METSQAIKEAADRLRATNDTDQRLEIFSRAARELSFEEPDGYEQAATALGVVREDTADFAREVLSESQRPDEATSFLIFATGAIACRRSEDKRSGEGLIDMVRGRFGQLALFKHFDALSLEGGNKRQLRRGLALEREVLAEGGSHRHAGGSHLIARFILQLNEVDETIGEVELDEALEAVDEAIELRPDYAKFFATRAALYTRLGRFGEAREDLLKAIRLEDRGSIDARERVAEYKFEKRMIEMHRTLRAVAEKAKTIEARSEMTAERLRGAELSVITAVAFVAGILSLIQITLTNISGRPVGDSILIVGSFAAILFAAVALGAWLLRRPWRSLAQTASSETSRDID